MTNTTHRTSSWTSEVWATLGERRWELTGWKAGLLLLLPVLFTTFCFVVGVVTVVGWVI